MKSINIHQRTLTLLIAILLSTVTGNAQNYSTHSFRVEGNLFFIPIGFSAYDYRPIENLSFAVGAGLFALDDSNDIYKFGYMTRVSGLIGKNSKYFEIGGGIMAAESKYPMFIVMNYRYQPNSGWLWGVGARFIYRVPDKDEMQGLTSLFSLVGISFQFGYAF
jgi:hypothetical protein